MARINLEFKDLALRHFMERTIPKTTGLVPVTSNEQLAELKTKQAGLFTYISDDGWRQNGAGPYLPAVMGAGMTMPLRSRIPKSNIYSQLRIPAM